MRRLDLGGLLPPGCGARFLLTSRASTPWSFPACSHRSPLLHKEETESPGGSQHVWGHMAPRGQSDVEAGARTLTQGLALPWQPRALPASLFLEVGFPQHVKHSSAWVVGCWRHLLLTSGMKFSMWQILHSSPLPPLHPHSLLSPRSRPSSLPFPLPPLPRSLPSPFLPHTPRLPPCL